MPNIYSPEPKPRPKISMLSPTKIKETFENPKTVNFPRSKAISCIHTENQPYEKPINRQSFFVHGSLYEGNLENRQVNTQENPTKKVRLSSKQNKQNQAFQSFRHLKSSENSQSNCKLQQNKFHPQTHLEKNYFKNKFLHFESLRSTLSNNQNSSQNLQPITNQKNNQNYRTLANKESFSDKKFQKKQIHGFNPTQISNIIQPSVMGSDEKQRKSKQQKNQGLLHFLSPRKISHFNQLKENTQPNFFSKKQDQTANRERKFPSFLSTRNDNKEIEREKKTSFRQFKPFISINLGKQKISHTTKTPQMKRLMNAKHVKSYSVFENLSYGNLRNQNENRKLLIASNFPHNEHEYLKQKITNDREKSHSIQQNKTATVEAFQSGPERRNEFKRDISFFRKSLDQSSLHLKSAIKKNSLQRQEVLNIPFHLQQKFQEDQKKYSQNKEEIIFQKIQPERFSKKTSKQENIVKKVSSNNLQTIDDIKQTLINCNLFSQEDYKGVIKNHQKDILKHTRKNFTQKVQFEIEQSKPKPSIKQFIDTSSQSEDSLHNNEEQKRLAGIASICERKRSKWMLQQIDTIKESLKELSEFNTQKSLYENEWKKISLKDFTSSRKNRCSVQFENIDQVKEEESIFESRDFKLSSVKILSKSIVEEDSTENQERLFNKRPSKEMRFNKIQFWNVNLEDFTMSWNSEEQIPLRNAKSQFELSYVTYTAQHRMTKTLYTIKKYEKSHLQKLGQLFISNFIKQLKIQMFILDHPNIEKIYSIFSDNLNIYLLCEFTSTKLSNVLAQNKNFNILNSSQQSIQLNTLSSQFQKIQLFKEIVDGLEEVHINRIIHKNFQPNSIRIVCQTCKISSFENCQISKNSYDRRVSHTYVCPENLFDSSLTAMDIWCLGILAYELLIGKKPFQNEKDSSNNTVKKILQCNFAIPSQKTQLCEQILNMALKRNPKDRASVFDIKNAWEKKLSKFSALIFENQKVHKKLEDILSR